MNAESIPPHSAAASTDQDPRCPRCEYNLTGLTTPRCPECGQTFDWSAVQAAAHAPQISFERASGVRKLVAFPLTAIQVLFVPWRFARQIVQRVDHWHALAFVGVCFAWTFLAMLLADTDLAVMLAWLTTAAIYIILQTIGLTLVDVADWDRLLPSARFWMLTGCYTSAVMLTEIHYGPPIFALSDVWQVLRRSFPGAIMHTLFELNLQAGVWWTQLLIWLFGLACIYDRRLRRRYRLRLLVWPATLLTVVGLFILYGAVIEHIGLPLGEWYYDLLE